MPPAGVFLVPARKTRKNRLGEALTVKPVGADVFRYLVPRLQAVLPEILLGPSMFSLPPKRHRRPSVPATRSGRLLCHRQRSHRSPLPAPIVTLLLVDFVVGRWLLPPQKASHYCRRQSYHSKEPVFILRLFAGDQ